MIRTRVTVAVSGMFPLMLVIVDCGTGRLKFRILAAGTVYRMGHMQNAACGEVPTCGESTHNIHGTEPFHSQANSFPGENQPIGPRPIRSMAFLLPGQFIPWLLRSLPSSRKLS